MGWSRGLWKKRFFCGDSRAVPLESWGGRAVLSLWDERGLWGSSYEQELWCPAWLRVVKFFRSQDRSER